MIRANLLPRPKENVRVFGFEFDAEYFRQALSACAVIVSVALIGIGIECLRIHRFEVTIASEEGVLATHTAQREQTKRLALDVARYQEFAREAEMFRRSGPEAAIAVARIGNAVPNRVWLDAIDRNAGAYQLSGVSTSVEALSGTILSLGRALPASSASLVSIDNRGADGGGVKFSARVDEPSPAPVAAGLVR